MGVRSVQVGRLAVSIQTISPGTLFHGDLPCNPSIAYTIIFIQFIVLVSCIRTSHVQPLLFSLIQINLVK